MLICSRNQIESSELGGGYVNNFSTKNFADFIKSKNNKYLIMSRDHCGPFKRDGKKKKLNDEIDNCKISLKEDIKNDFNIIHIDTAECGNRKYEVADELLNFCNTTAENYNKKIFFEFGCEEHGILTNFNKFKKDIDFFSKFKNRQYIVCQTGSLVKSVFQVGQFDIETVKIMKKIADEKGLLLKEHNCDYLNYDQIKLRKKYGIDAINIAPELGVIQTNLLYNFAKFFCLDKEISQFIKYVLKSGKWKKWNYNNENGMIKFFTAGHYHFTSKYYKSLISKIKKKTNFQFHLNKSIERNLLKYFN